MEPLNIVELIETNPITKLSGDYNNKLIVKIKNTFGEFEQQLFLSSFYCYLNYHPTNDFIIDLDNVWKWIGFSQKIKAKQIYLLPSVPHRDFQMHLFFLLNKTNLYIFCNSFDICSSCPIFCGPGITTNALSVIGKELTLICSILYLSNISLRSP